MAIKNSACINHRSENLFGLEPVFVVLSGSAFMRISILRQKQHRNGHGGLSNHTGLLKMLLV